MKILKFKGKMSVKNKALIAIVILLIIAIIGMATAYIENANMREWININVLRKEVNEDEVATIQIDSDKSQFICAYDKYIGILANGKLEVYNNYGYKSADIDVQISSPIFETCANYLAIGEKDGQNVYLISERKGNLGW